MFKGISSMKESKKLKIKDKRVVIGNDEYFKI